MPLDTSAPAAAPSLGVTRNCQVLPLSSLLGGTVSELFSVASCAPFLSQMICEPTCGSLSASAYVHVADSVSLTVGTAGDSTGVVAVGAVFWMVTGGDCTCTPKSVPSFGLSV